MKLDEQEPQNIHEAVVLGLVLIAVAPNEAAASEAIAMTQPLATQLTKPEFELAQAEALNALKQTPELLARVNIGVASNLEAVINELNNLDDLWNREEGEEPA